jgi:5'(3')-deoxyribonucleotidase
MTIRIICDLDGVLANFYEPALRHHEREDLITNYPRGTSWLPDVLGITVPEFWAALPYDFFATLPLMPDADILIQGIKVMDPAFYVCSTAGPLAHVVRQKIEWMRGYLGSDFSRYVILGGGMTKETQPNKNIIAASNHILIDDFDNNVDEFRKAGGMAVLVPRPWNSQWERSDIAAKVTLESVTELISRY